MAENLSHSHALDQLQAMVNAILIQVGRVFVNPSNNPRAAANTNAQLKQLIPATLNRFHEALDELEEEIMHAKMIMRRDLALCQASRLQPLKQNQAQGSAADVKREPSEQNAAKVEQEQPQDVEPQQNEDAVMTDQPATSGTNDVTTTSDLNVPAQHKAPLSRQPSEQHPPFKTEALQPGPLNGLNPSTPGRDALREQARAPSPLAPTPQNGPSAPTSIKEEDRVPTLPESQTDYTANTAHAAGTDFKFDTLDYSASNANQHLYSATQDDNNTTDTNNINSLLPGLESYANASSTMDDLTGMNMNLSNNGFSGPTNMRGGADETDAPSDEPQMTESNFNDWFNSIDMGDAGNAGVEEGAGNVMDDVEFDNAWFDFKQT